MVFGQLTNRNSRRDLIVIPDTYSRPIHLGFGKSVTKSNMVKANEKYKSKIFEEFAYYLIDIAQKKL